MDSDERSLADIGTEILDQFLKFIETTSTNQDDSISRSWKQLLDEFERFQLFAANMSLVQRGHSSLDYRLREADLLETTVRRLLRDLINSLDEGSQLCEEKLIHNDNLDPASQPLKDDETVNKIDMAQNDLLESGYGQGAEGDVPAIDLILESITDSNDRLFKLATKVRNPSIHHIASKAYQYKDVDEATGIDVIEEYRKYDREHVIEIFKSCDTATLDEPFNYLVNRLSRAKTFRRQQFGFWRRRRRKLQIAHPLPAPKVNVRSNIATSSKELPAPEQAPLGAATSKPYTATTLNPIKIDIDDNTTNLSVSEYAPTAAGLKNQTINWPLPPSKLNGKKHFECPYCFTLCPSGYLEMRAWRAHLRRDLRPYLCTYEHCVEGDRLFDHRQDWLNHEASAHRLIWRCVEHDTKTFENRGKYEDHLRDQHQHDVRLQSPEVLRAGQSTSGASDRPCPFCGVSLANAPALQDHIAVHLERVALFALPRSTGIDDESIGSEGASDQPNIRDDNSRNVDFDIESFGDFSTTSSTPELASVHHEQFGGDIESRSSGQQLNQLAIRALEAIDKSNGRVEIDSFLDHVEAATSDTVSLDAAQQPTIEGSGLNDSIDDHWVFDVFTDMSVTTLEPSEEDAECHGELMPDALEWLKRDGMQQLLKIGFGRHSLHVYLFARATDHRARILCETPERSGNCWYSCMPFNRIHLRRSRSIITLYSKVSGTNSFTPWASLPFTSMERLVLFYNTCLALRSNDIRKPVSNITDHELNGEAGLFAGEIRDDNYRHALHIYRDHYSRAVRLQASVLTGELKNTPVWTAFITDKIPFLARDWMRLEGRRLICLRSLKRHIFISRYDPPMHASGEHVLEFVASSDARDFMDTIDDLAEAYSQSSKTE